MSEVINLNEPLILIQDMDCHWYLIRKLDKKNFLAWCNGDEQDRDFDSLRIDNPQSVEIWSYREV